MFVIRHSGALGLPCLFTFDRLAELCVMCVPSRMLLPMPHNPPHCVCVCAELLRMCGVFTDVGRSCVPSSVV
jgi:hypothetical protein